MATSLGTLRRVIIRVVLHLTRTRARVAWLLIGAAVCAYMVFDVDVIRQTSLVLASVAAAAVFLPELSSGLWTMKAADIRRTMPSSQVEALQFELIDAQSGDQDWARQVWTHGLKPMIEAGIRPLQVQWRLTYDVQVYLEQPIEISGQHTKMHRVHTKIRSERMLPEASVGRVWVSVARTNEALLKEYELEGCLLRELVELPGVSPADWRAEILKSCEVSIWIDGGSLTLQESASDLLDVVRWEGPVTRNDDSSGLIPVSVKTSFPLVLGQRTFPIVFASYYCAGQTEISFTVYHPSRAVELDAHNFCSRLPGGKRAGDESHQRGDSETIDSLSFTTGQDTLLSPGSGMLFEWNLETIGI